MPKDFFVKSEAGVSRITLDRELRRNALTRPMLVGLTEELKSLASDSAVRLIEIAAEGSVFCAGMDLGEMKDRAEQSGPEDWLQDSLVYRDLLLAIIEAPQPVMAIVQGPVLAGGVGIVLACDLMLATENVFLSLPEPQRGITASMVMPLLLRKVGVGHAGHLLLSGQRIKIDQMCGWGICQAIVETSKLADEAADWREKVLQGSPQALASTKLQLLQFSGDVRAVLDKTAKLSAQARASEDAQEGLAAFLEKRKPNWQT
jgi:methylglutaconyl-CoA hydratase